jgi:putative transposase
VKHGLVSRVVEWPFSSFHRDVSAGLFPQDWAGEFAAVGEFGEASNGVIN